MAARLETIRPPGVAGSYGPEARAWIAAYLDRELWPWQAYALERAFEHDADGELYWTTVLLTVSRQIGKSLLAGGACSWRLGAADLFGEPQNVLNIANKRDRARELWRGPARSLRASVGASVRYANGSESVELADGSEWKIDASTIDAGVGSSNSMVLVDEAWRVATTVVDDSIGPTLAQRASPQLWLVSTAGDGGSELLTRERDAALAQLDDPAARTLLLEWSAPADADPDDPSTWRQASPHWNERRRRFVAGRRRSIDDAAFRTQYLNQWVRAVRAWLTPTQWAAAARPGSTLPSSRAGTVAIEAAVEGYPYGLVHAVADGDTVHVTGRVFDRRTALFEHVDALARARRGLTLLYSPAFEGFVPRSLPIARAERVGVAEQFTGYAPVVTAAAEGRLLHDGSPELAEHVLIASTSTVTDRGTLLSTKASPGPIYLARSLVWAAGFELRPNPAPRVLVVSAA